MAERKIDIVVRPWVTSYRGLSNADRTVPNRRASLYLACLQKQKRKKRKSGTENINHPLTIRDTIKLPKQTTK